MGGSIGVDVIAGSHHHQPGRSIEDAEKISLDIQDLGEGEIGNTANNTAQEVDGRREKMLHEYRGDIGGKSSGSAGQHALDKVGEPDYYVGDDEGCGRPHHGDGLDTLDTRLGMGI